MMELITSREDARRCFAVLVETSRITSDLVGPHRASFRPGSVAETAYFYRDEDIWIMPTDGRSHSAANKRYWNCFGLGGSPTTASSQIVVEINHPHEGVNRRLTGRFLRRGDDYFLAHTGRLGGGRGDSSAHAFAALPESHSFDRIVVDGTLLYLVTRLRPEGFRASVSRFVRVMAKARYGSLYA